MTPKDAIIALLILAIIISAISFGIAMDVQKTRLQKSEKTGEACFITYPENVILRCPCDPQPDFCKEGYKDVITYNFSRDRHYESVYGCELRTISNMQVLQQVNCETIKNSSVITKHEIHVTI